MTIDFHIQIGGDLSDAEKVKAWKSISSVFTLVDSVYNKWNANSEVAKFNAWQSSDPVPVSREFFLLLQQADELYKLTGGLCDPTIEPLQKVWKEALSQGEIPSHQKLSEIQTAIGWDKIHFTDKEISKTHPLTSLDFGGMAKGLAVDLLFERLQGDGFSDLYVEWGGEIRVSEHHPSGRPWQVAISPVTQGATTIVLSLSSQSVATSGDYEQFWRVEDSSKQIKEFFHIFNPQTLFPLERHLHGIASSTVVAPTCILADGLAKTGLFFDDIDKAEAWAKKFKDNNATFLFLQKEATAPFDQVPQPL